MDVVYLIANGDSNSRGILCFLKPLLGDNDANDL